MLNAGLIPFAVVDDHKAEFWAQVLPEIRLRPELALRSGGEIAWAFRKNSPKLKAAARRLRPSTRQGDGLRQPEVPRYLKRAKTSGTRRSQQELAKLLKTIHFFQKYASAYEFDWLMLAAQGYQESRLDQNVKSAVGAIGVMQVMPATGRGAEGGRHPADREQHPRGAKYMRTLLDRYFPDAKFDALNRCLFAFAAYNAGPGAGGGPAQAGRRPRSRSRTSVQPRRGDRRRTDRPGDGPLREQHLQVLRRVPAGGRAAARPREGARKLEAAPRTAARTAPVESGGSERTSATPVREAREPRLGVR